MNNPFIICIIDDDDVYQYTITKTLKAEKIAKKIMVFSDGEEALDFMADNISNNEKLPDVIFLDINMPVMDGWQFLEEYVKIKPKVEKQITIYVISSSVNPEDINRAQKISDISDYLIKPIAPEDIKGILELHQS